MGEKKPENTSSHPDANVLPDRVNAAVYYKCSESGSEVGKGE